MQIVSLLNHIKIITYKVKDGEEKKIELGIEGIRALGHLLFFFLSDMAQEFSN